MYISLNFGTNLSIIYLGCKYTCECMDDRRDLYIDRYEGWENTTLQLHDDFSVSFRNG